MSELLPFLRGTLATWASDGVPVPVLVALALAVLGFFLPRGIFRLAGVGGVAILRTALFSALLLVGLGALVAALLYATSGVRLAEAWEVDPLGGVAYFLATGAQLALLGLVVAAARTATLAARGAHRRLR
jgi:hypothetical protein